MTSEISCLLCASPLESNSMRACHKECWAKWDQDPNFFPESKNIDWEKYNTGCECCCTDICRLSVKHKECFRIFGPKFSDGREYSCEYCPSNDDYEEICKQIHEDYMRRKAVL